MNIPAGPWPYHEEDEIEAAVRVLRSGQVNYWNGQEGRKFEEEFAAYIGVNHAIAVSNGTVALELALYALGIGSGDEVIVTPRSFVASASSIVMRGATPVFADVDPDSQNITPETARSVITDKTKAIICVHLSGWPCDMHGFRELADEHGLYLVEDCAQAHGAKINGQCVGSFGDINAFSFCTDKIISTAGEGGMVATNDEKLWKKAWAYKDHGKSYDTVYHKDHAPGFRWLHEDFGTNWRMPEVQSAIGRCQLRKLDRWIEKRRKHAQYLIDELDGIKAIRIPLPPKTIQHTYYKFDTFLNPENLEEGWSRDRIISEFASCGLPGRSGSCSEMYNERCFDKLDLRPAEALPNAKTLGATCMQFYVHHTQTEEHMQYVKTVIRDIMFKASV